MSALVPDLRKFIVGLEVKNSAAVAEATWRKISGMINFLGHRVHQEKYFKVNGAYGGLAGFYPINAFDGLAFFEYDAEIFNVWTYNLTAGTSGTTELDLKRKPKASGSFTSIFSTTPKILSTAGNDTFFEIGDSATGIVAPVLDTVDPTYSVNAGDSIRLDVISAMPGAQHCGLVIHFRPR